MIEQWKTWKETNSRYGYRIYDISNFGNVLVNCEPYECPIRKDGYKYISKTPLHRIVAELFLPDWDPNKEVDHKDCNRLNNMVTNLLLCDHKQNMNNPTTLKKMSISNKGKGRPRTEEHKRKISLANKGHLVTEETRNKISEFHKGNKYHLGYKLNEETKKQISLNVIKYYWDKNKIYYDNHYIVVYKNNTKVIYTEFLEDAANYLNVTSLKICAAMFSGAKIKGWIIKPVDGNNPYEGDEPWHVKIKRNNG